MKQFLKHLLSLSLVPSPLLYSWQSVLLLVWSCLCEIE